LFLAGGSGGGRQCVFLCVGDSAMSESLILGQDGIAQGAAPRDRGR
jgi:3-hydroxyisobutyrate dehydrogenase-like beta-hydroxyacid dehydrogenase